MSKNFILFDKTAYSARIVLLVDGGHKLFEDEAEAISVGVKALEKAKLSRALSMPVLEEFCWASSPESSLSMVHEDGGEIEGLLDSEQGFSGTGEPPRQRVADNLKRLREMVGGGEVMDVAQLFQETISCVKRLQIEVLTEFK
ncbi:hypothetical protein SUGI_0845690 [Cryptomeria japonica]|uniref:uncharacterized protein LOC131034970 n=1 Tax=Cryptomeria japonica TaxID=3369 RepID=UPI0024147544|nr:uncharacterized protein LOC131034970 [Cryptomeria japonica]GLJ40880.1 hypothetical protein SUGI_0845690 [Cryptomeria japonica]